MTLPQNDLKFLADREIAYRVSAEANMICVEFPGYSLPRGYNIAQSTLLLRLNPGYPDVQPDMWWFDPPVLLANGTTVAATEVRENHLGRTWQRWSRHFNPGQWRPGIDSLQSFLALVRKELERHTVGVAA